MAVKYRTDRVYRDVGYLSTPSIDKVSLKGGRLIVRSAIQGEAGIAVVDNLATSLIPTVRNEEGQLVQYRIDPSKIRRFMRHFHFGYEDYRVTSIAGYRASPNGKYVLVVDRDVGVVKINLDTGEETVVGDYVLPPFDIRGAVWIVGTISNDGRYIYLRNGRMIDTQGCGDSLRKYDYKGRNREPLASPCRHLDLIRMVPYSDVISQWRGINYDGFEFTHGNYAITYYLSEPMSGPSPGSERVVIKAPGFEDRPHDWTSGWVDPSSPMSYLALGDSYSSGEGDLEKKDGVTYYTPVTDEPGGCHLSTRSYPFLLRDKWSMSVDEMQSVACSGALVGRDYMADISSYMGQHSELANLSDDDKSKARSRALEVFLPGRVPQLEFVKKYTPRVITLTGGGNDVGFADVLAYCASDVLETLAFGYSCEYVEGKALNQVLKDSISSQYEVNKELVEKLKQASPTTRIYLVGYPSFIAPPGDGGGCAANSVTIDGPERTMINDALIEFNKMQEKVAADTGVEYIDIESALHGGRICEGSKYVTGVWDKGYRKVMKDDKQEVFHPNALGHKRIAERIHETIGNNPYRAVSPSSSSHDVAEPKRNTFMHPLLRNLTFFAGAIAKLSVPAGTLGASSTGGIDGFSERVDLGEFTAAADGSLGLDITLPDELKPGRHVILLEGTSPSGDPIALYQFVTIVSNDPDDIDGDGIEDDRDNCLFISSWYDESSGVDVCKPTADGQTAIGSKSQASGALSSSAGLQRNTQTAEGLLMAQSTENVFAAADKSDLASSGSAQFTEGAPNPTANHDDTREDGEQWVWIAAIAASVAIVIGATIATRRIYETRKK